MHPLLDLYNQPLCVFGIDLCLFFYRLDFLTNLPNIYSSLDLFGIPSKTLTFCLPYFDKFPYTLRIAILERTDFNDLHLFIFDLY
jgi:hypothetical protein